MITNVLKNKLSYNFEYELGIFLFHANRDYFKIERVCYYDIYSNAKYLLKEIIEFVNINNVRAGFMAEAQNLLISDIEADQLFNEVISHV